MASKLVRVGTVGVCFTLLLVDGPTPAGANTALSATFVGTVTLDDPIGSPCTGFGPSVDLSLCPFPTPGGKTATVDASKPLQTTVNGTPVTTPQLHIRITHPQNPPKRIRTLTSNTCVDTVVNVAKGSKAPMSAGGCTFNLGFGPLGNTVSGNCGMSSGQTAVTFTDGQGQTYIIDISFLSMGGLLVSEGHSTKVTGGTTSLVKGITLAIPPTPVSGGGSCANKTATVFTLVGTIEIIGTN